MSKAEIVAFNTGAELSKVEVGASGDDERTAYLTGAARACLGRGITGFLLLSRADLALMLSDDAYGALERLSRDSWAHWARRGYEDARR